MASDKQARRAAQERLVEAMAVAVRTCKQV